MLQAGVGYLAWLKTAEKHISSKLLQGGPNTISRDFVQ